MVDQSRRDELAVDHSLDQVERHVIVRVRRLRADARIVERQVVQGACDPWRVLTQAIDQLETEAISSTSTTRGNGSVLSVNWTTMALWLPLWIEKGMPSKELPSFKVTLDG